MLNLITEDWKHLLKREKEPIIIDVRTAVEYEEGIIQGAINIDVMKEEEFIKTMETMDKRKNYYVYCHSGGRSSHACKIMETLGFKHVTNLLGGMCEWTGEIVYPD